MVTHSPPTFEVGSSNPRTCVGKLVVGKISSSKSLTVLPIHPLKTLLLVLALLLVPLR